MRKAKEIIRDRKEIEDKLTQYEINYNKVNYVKETLKSEIRKSEKEIEHSTPKGIEKVSNKISKNKESIQKALKKIDILSKKEYKDEKLRESNIFAQKTKIKKYKRDNKELKKKLKKYKNIKPKKYASKINDLNKEIEKLTPELNKKKEKVDKYRKKYKEIGKEWNELFQDIDDSISLSVKDLNIFYGNKQALFNVSMDFPKNQVIAIIGPSGCGKSTFLKTLNRINDEIPSFRAQGKILLQSEVDILTLKNIYDPSARITLPELRTKIGMVFQQPNPFPMSIFNNVAYGPRINGIKNRSVLKEIVNESLKKAAIYDQVKGNLNALATGLSGGQQQRLCIARAIANRPDVLLMDEPTSALDPIAAAKVEDLILELKKDYTIIMVTHSMQQAARVSDRTAFFYQGELIEYGETKQIFTKPKEKRTDDYIRGKFG